MGAKSITIVRAVTADFFFKDSNLQSFLFVCYTSYIKQKIMLIVDIITIVPVCVYINLLRTVCVTWL
jgi:hypothetical protein